VSLLVERPIDLAPPNVVRSDRGGHVCRGHLAILGSVRTVVCVEQPAFSRDDTTLLFEVLFDIKKLLALLVEYVEGGEDDGGEEEEEADEP
jgi:hypothetical protein